MRVIKRTVAGLKFEFRFHPRKDEGILRIGDSFVLTPISINDLEDDLFPFLEEVLLNRKERLKK